MLGLQCIPVGEKCNNMFYSCCDKAVCYRESGLGFRVSTSCYLYSIVFNLYLKMKFLPIAVLHYLFECTYCHLVLNVMILVIQSGVCVDCIGEGQKCQYHSQCCTYLKCQKGNALWIDGTCGPEKPDGEECYENDQCRGFCKKPTAALSGVCTSYT